MKKILEHITNFYLYSSLHIGLCSVYLYLFTIQRFHLSVDLKYLIFVFASTIFIYSIHRLIGIKKVKKFSHKGRFAVIEKFRFHILLYVILSSGASVYLLLSFDIYRIFLLFWAGIISILYTVPIFRDSKRLRDFSMVKIFLIAIVWSYVTGVIPMYEQGTALRPLLIYFLEIVLFFIAITIPFDIRDLSVDRANDVKTLPYLLGRKLSTLIALFLLLITFFLDAGLVYWFHFDIRGTISMTFTCIITAGIIYAVRRKESDYYFSGLLETAIMFPYSIYVLILYFLS